MTRDYIQVISGSQVGQTMPKLEREMRREISLAIANGQAAVANLEAKKEDDVDVAVKGAKLENEDGVARTKSEPVDD